MKAGGARPRWLPRALQPLHQGRVLALIFYGEHSSGLPLYGLACAQGEVLGTPSSLSTQGSAVNPNLTVLLALSFKPSSVPAPQPGCSLPTRPLAQPWHQLGVPEPWPRCATMAQPWHRWRAAQPPAVVQDPGGARAAPMPRAAWCEFSMSYLEFLISGCAGLVSLGLLSPSVN